MADEEIDDDFLSQLAFIEAQAISKRPKLTSTSSPSPLPPPEGAYTAALKGSRSAIFQHQQHISSPIANSFPIRGGGGGGGECFKCGKLGHWARDCESSGVGGGIGGADVAEKMCPCGVGVCISLTANTEKNRGRKFYKCPLREENGGCGFFEWCDKNTEAGHTAVKSQSYASNASTTDLYGGDVAEKTCPCGVGVCVFLTANTEKNRGRKFYKCPLREENGGCGFFEWCDKNTEADPTTVRSQSYASNASASDLSCPCGAGVCLILTAKTGKNIGQHFYRCPANQAMSCGFFEWCHDLKANGDSLSFSTNASNTCKTSMTSQDSVAKNSGLSCFKCGKDGHWARDCSFSANATTTTTYKTSKTNQKQLC